MEKVHATSNNVPLIPLVQDLGLHHFLTNDHNSVFILANKEKIGSETQIYNVAIILQD